MAIIINPGGIYALCPHCKKENVELKVKFMYQCEVEKCKLCGKSYTWEMLNLPGPQGSTQTITNVSPSIQILTSPNGNVSERICSSTVTGTKFE